MAAKKMAVASALTPIAALDASEGGMSVAKALAARTITFLLDGLQGPTNREAREILEQALADAELRREKEVRETEERRSSEVTGLGQQLAEVVAQRDEARGQLNEVRERAKAAEARLAALTAPVDGEPSEEALGLVWRQSVDARAESKDPFGGSQHQHRLALWRAGAAHERVRTAQLRAEVSEARADRDKAIAELEATNLRVAELESADALLDMSTPEHVVNAELRSIGVDHDALAERTLKFVDKVRDEVRIATDEDFRGLIRMAVKNRIWFEIAGDNVWVGTDHYPHGGDVDTAIAILERELRERAIRYGAAAGAAKKGA